jgi:hypothetical protein
MNTWKLEQVLWFFIVLMGLLLLAGCQSYPSFGDSKEYSTAQLKELVKDKNGGVICIVAPTPWGMIHMTSANLDQAPRVSGSIEVDANCTTKMNSTAVQPVKEPSK